jgi:superfamily II DNA or RNA helicase
MTARVIIANQNEVYAFISCEDGIAYELREYFSFRVNGYQFMPHYKAKHWDGFIRLFDPKKRQLYRGLVQHLIKLCEQRSYSWQYDDKITRHELTRPHTEQFAKALNLTHVPHDYQIEAFQHAINVRRSLLLSPTSSGKSLIIYLIVRYLLSQRCKKGLIIVPTINLVEQLFTDFIEYSTNNNWNVEDFTHRVYQGYEKETTKRLTISTWQSLYKMPKEFFEQFDFVVGDECHLFKAKSLTDIMTGLINSRYRIGLTGTLDNTEVSQMVLEGLFGTVKKVTSTKALMDRKLVSDFQIKCLLLKHPDTICKIAKTFTYQEEMQYLVSNEARNRFICNLTLSLKNNTLVLFQFIENHGKILLDMIKKATDRKCFFIYGGTEVEIREETRRIVETQTNAIIIASYPTFSMGVNIKNLHNIVFASPSKSRIRNLQSIGRGLRLSETKSIATLFDIADDLRYQKHDNFTLRHFSSRVKLYSEEKFEFKIIKIPLK